MRRKLKTKKPIRPDHKYTSPKVAKFINYIMYDGKKSVAERIVYNMLKTVEEKFNLKVKINKTEEIYKDLIGLN